MTSWGTGRKGQELRWDKSVGVLYVLLKCCIYFSFKGSIFNWVDAGFDSGGRG